MPALGRKLHHIVPRRFLKAWLSKGKILCLQNGLIHPRKLKEVGAENYFYRLHELSDADVYFIENLIIKDSPEELKESHRRLVWMFTLPHRAKRVIEENGGTAEQIAEIDRQIIEMNENFHTSIEDDFEPLFISMQSGDMSFLQNVRQAAPFYSGLAMQYSRTHHIKGAERIMSPQRLELYLRTVNPVMHIMAVNAGRSLFLDRKRHTVILLDNATDVPFVTARPTDHQHYCPPERLHATGEI